MTDATPCGACVAARRPPPPPPLPQPERSAGSSMFTIVNSFGDKRANLFTDVNTRDFGHRPGRAPGVVMRVVALVSVAGWMEETQLLGRVAQSVLARPKRSHLKAAASDASDTGATALAASSSGPQLPELPACACVSSTGFRSAEGSPHRASGRPIHLWRCLVWWRESGRCRWNLGGRVRAVSGRLELWVCA